MTLSSARLIPDQVLALSIDDNLRPTLEFLRGVGVSARAILRYPQVCCMDCIAPQSCRCRDIWHLRSPPPLDPRTLAREE